MRFKNRSDLVWMYAKNPLPKMMKEKLKSEENNKENQVKTDQMSFTTESLSARREFRLFSL